MPAKGTRKCLHCSEMFIPDPRTRDRQRHCSKTECKRASKAYCQRRWIRKKENKGYFSGPENVARVQAWRLAHPGYWKRSRGKEVALQDDCQAQPIQLEEDMCDSILSALQDDLTTQSAVLVGLISSFIGSALQDDIAVAMRRAHACGLQFFGMVPGIQYGDGNDACTKKDNLSGTSATNTQSVQLGGPATGP